MADPVVAYEEPIEAAELDDEEETSTKRPDRDQQLCRLKGVRDQLLGGADKRGGILADVEAGFQAQADRSDTIIDNWEAYKCRLGGAQAYNGNSRVFFPIFATAVRARVTRFANQLFPQSGRYIDGASPDGKLPLSYIALLENYIRRMRLKNTIVKPLLKNGDLEGNYTIYVDWKSIKRKTARREMAPVMEEGEERPEYGEHERFVEEETEDAGPDIEVISDSDFLVLPVTAKSIDEAVFECGGSVTIRRRFSRRMVKTMIEEGDIDKREGEDYLDAMSDAPSKPGRRDVAKAVGEAAGIRVHKGLKTAVVAETWTLLKVKGGRELCRTYWGGENILLGVKRNPFWHGRVPVITEPLDRDATAIKGRPPVSDAMEIQIAANDMVNEAVDTSSYSAMPIVINDPEKNPKSDTMILGLGAVWDGDPNSMQFASFPALYKELLPFIEKLEQVIFQTLGVNPSMLPQSTGKPGAKRNQAEVALEQQVDLLTTADATGVVEDVLNQFLTMAVELDHQFRDKPTTVREFGPMGRKANMQAIEPITLQKGFEFVWLGVEAARNAAMAQQNIAFLATLMKIPPQMMQGKKIDLSAAINSITLTQLGTRIASQTLLDLADEQSIPPEEEEEMLGSGFSVMVHPLDNDVKHLQVHMTGMQKGDPHGVRSMHIQGHLHQRQAKAMAAQQQMQAQGPRGRGQAGASPQGASPTPKLPGAQPADELNAQSGAMPRDDHM